MTPEADSQIHSLVDRLDDLVPREGHLEVLRDPDNGEYTLIRANKHGYLRLGAALAKAAYAPTTSRGGRELVDVDLGHLTGLDEDRYCFERREDVWSPLSEPPSNGVSNVVGMLIGLTLLAALGTGVFTIAGWILRLVGRLL